MLNTQSSELSESIQDLKNFQVFVRVKPLNKDEIPSQLSSRKSPDRFLRNNQSIQQQQPQFSSYYGSQSGIQSPLVQKQNGGSMSNNCQGYQQFGQSQNNNNSSTGESIIKIDEENNTIFLNDPEYRNIDKREKAYPFDGVLSDNSTNYDTFERAVLPSLSGILEGYNATFFAYGITGSGKTHTIFGRNGGLIKQSNKYNYSSYNGITINGLDQANNAQHTINNGNNQIYDNKISDRGICYMAIEYLLQNLDFKNTTLKFSFLEIYNETVRDLLNGQNNLKNLTIIEDPATKNICVQDLKEYQITSIAQIEELIEEGNQRRALAPTSANQFSSRSHAILILSVTQRQIDVVTKIEEIVTSKLTIIDLAGSEKGSDKQGKGSLEGSNINRSLLALGNCINILSEKKRLGSHVPYRDSKLTRILKDTLGGNTKTVMIACVSQSYLCLDETINTLSYASRATNIKRKISKNVAQDPDYFQQKELIKELQSELALYKSKGSISNGGILNATPPLSHLCHNCHQNKKALLSYDCSNFESVYAKSTAHSSLDTKIKQEKQLLQGQIQELTEQIKQSLLLENSLGEDINLDSIEQQIRIRNEQQNNQEEFLNRICNDLFQNVIESHQLITSLQEIEELLVQDYQKLLYYQKNQIQSNQVQGLINQLQDSIRENEEIKEKMKLVLDTNQEQKQNLKYVLLRISNKKQIQMEYDLKIRKQQLEFLDLLEIKSDLEKQISQQNQVIVDKDKLLTQISQENSVLKSQKLQQKSIGGINSQTDLPLSFSAIKMQISSDDVGQSKQLNNKNKQAIVNQQLQQLEQQMKNQSSLDKVKNYLTPNALLSQQTILQQQQMSTSSTNMISSYTNKQKTNSLTPLTKDLINYDNSNQLSSQAVHNKGSISQTSVQMVNSPQSMNPPGNITPKNDQKPNSSSSSSSSSIIYASKTAGKMLQSTQQNQQIEQQLQTPIYNSNTSQPNSNVQDIKIPITFTNYNTAPQSFISNSNVPAGMLKSSNTINPQSQSLLSSHINQAQSIYYNNTTCQQQQQQQQQQNQQQSHQVGTPTNQQQTKSSYMSSFNSANNYKNPQEHEKENKKYSISQEQQDNNYIQNLISGYQSNHPQQDTYISSMNTQLHQQNQQEQQLSSSSSNKPTLPLFTKSKSPSNNNNQNEFNINNILEQSRQFTPNIVQSSIFSQQALINSKTLQQSNQTISTSKREPQNAIIDLFQNAQTSISQQGLINNINSNNFNNNHSQQNSGGLFDKQGQTFSQQQLQQQQASASSSSSQILNSHGSNINNLSSGLLLSNKNRSQNKSGRYDNNGSTIEKAKQFVSEKLLEDKKTFLEEQFYSSNQQPQSQSYSDNLQVNQQIHQALPMLSAEPIANISDKVLIISPIDSFKNPMESRETGFNISNNKQSGLQNYEHHLNNNNNNINMNNNGYSEYELQSAALHTPLIPSQLYQDKSNAYQNMMGQSRRKINYDMDDFDDDCEPKMMSRRSSACNNGQPSHINDSATQRNPLETESELDHDEISHSSKKHSYVSSPQIHKTSRTICTQNVNLKKKNFDVFENDV